MRAVDVAIAEKAADAEVAIVHRTGIIRGDPIDLVLLDMDIHLALAAAVIADGRGFLELPGAGPELERLGDHGSRRAHRHTVPTEGTVLKP